MNESTEKEKIPLNEKILIYLRDDKPKEKFTSAEIANAIKNKYHSEYKEKDLKQLTAEVSSIISQKKEQLDIKVIMGPGARKYYWTDEEPENKEIDDRNQGIERQKQINEQTEEKLYEPLIKYLESEWAVKAVQIHHGKSSNTHGKGGNDWLHPDIVGVENLTSNLELITRALVNQSNPNRKKARIWSFEVKVQIKSISDVRNYFFQAVANSSWANFGYLAVGKIEDDIKTRKITKELRMLANLYGIGVIMINEETPEESSIVIHARERTEIDYVACDRLIKENNEDFIKFINKATNEYTIG